MPFFRNFPKTNYDFSQTGISTKVTDIFRYVKPIDSYLDDISTYKWHLIDPGERPDQVSQKLYGTPIYYWTFFILNEHLRRGMACWPMGQQEFDEYLATEYEGVTINSRPEIIRNSDGAITEYRNSIADRFEVGEPVLGIQSGATGKIIARNIDLSQLVIENVTGKFRENELIRGQFSLDEVTIYQVFDSVDAPHHYVDNDGREVDNSLFITGATFMNPDQEAARTITNREYEEEENESFREIRVIKPGLIKKFAERYESLVNGVG